MERTSTQSFSSASSHASSESPASFPAAAPDAMASLEPFATLFAVRRALMRELAAEFSSILRFSTPACLSICAWSLWFWYSACERCRFRSATSFMCSARHSRNFSVSVLIFRSSCTLAPFMESISPESWPMRRSVRCFTFSSRSCSATLWRREAICCSRSPTLDAWLPSFKSSSRSLVRESMVCCIVCICAWSTPASMSAPPWVIWSSRRCLRSRASSIPCSSSAMAAFESAHPIPPSSSGACWGSCSSLSGALPSEAGSAFPSEASAASFSSSRWMLCSLHTEASLSLSLSASISSVSARRFLRPTSSLSAATSRSSSAIRSWDSALEAAGRLSSDPLAGAAPPPPASIASSACT
mmetsp:Transcript_26883/g.64154  ORF Transcript_26883/g.64154 Transcript_26883/m.64154 type:complete len:356 (-) Transcript_26883:1154-2221(-)